MADDSGPVEEVPDVSLVTNDIETPSDDTPTESTDTPNEGVDGQDEQKTDEETSEGSQEPTEGEQPQQKPETDDEATIRARNEEYARRRIQERQRTKEAVAQQLDQEYGPKSVEELVDEGYSEAQAQIEALRQDVNYERQRTQIAELNAGMQTEAVNVQADFPVFNANSPEYDAEFAKEVEASYRQAARLQTDENGIVINAEVPLYDYYQRMNTIYSRGATKGQQQGQAEYQQMLARTENPGGSSSTSKGGNSLEELEERLGDMVIT